MQADREAGPALDAATGSALDALRTECWQQAHAIHSLTDTIAVYRAGASALTVENAALRSELGTLQARARNGMAIQAELTLALALDEHAPGAARAAVASVLGEDVTPATLDHARLIASELATNSVNHSAAPRGSRLVLRIERSTTMIRIEVEDPGHEGVIAIRLPDRSVGDGFGLNLVELLSERWGAERVVAGGTRVWAQLILATSVALPPAA